MNVTAVSCISYAGRSVLRRPSVLPAAVDTHEDGVASGGHQTRAISPGSNSDPRGLEACSDSCSLILSSSCEGTPSPAIRRQRFPSFERRAWESSVAVLVRCIFSGGGSDGCGLLNWPHCGRLNWPHLRPIGCRRFDAHRARAGGGGRNGVEDGAVRVAIVTLAR